MRVLIVSPFPPGTPGGNARTVERWRAGLAARGHAVAVAPLPSDGLLDKTPPEVTLLYHARRTGALAAAASQAGALVVALGGTDLDVDVRDPDRRPIVETAIALADRVIAVGDEQARRLEAELPAARGKTRVVPKAVVLGTAPFDLRAALAIPASSTLAVLPAGLRAVKDPTFAIAPLARLRAEGLDVRLALLGPELEPEETARVRARQKEHPWVAGTVVPPDAMAAALAAADVVLNTSRSEGFANAVAEALAIGSCVLASDVPGNRLALQDGTAGVLYSAGDVEDFTTKARALLGDPAERARWSVRALASAWPRFDPAREAEALEGVLAEAVRARGS